MHSPAGSCFNNVNHSLPLELSGPLVRSAWYCSSICQLFVKHWHCLLAVRGKWERIQESWPSLITILEPFSRNHSFFLSVELVPRFPESVILDLIRIVLVGIETRALELGTNKITGLLVIKHTRKTENGTILTSFPKKQKTNKYKLELRFEALAS